MCPPYQSKSPTPEENQRKADFDRFVESLRQLPRFIVRLGYLQKTRKFKCPSCSSIQLPTCSTCGDDLPYSLYQQKGVDVKLSIDLTQISASKRIERAIILSADGDFSPAIEQAKENMVIVTWAFFEQQKSWILNSACDERILIDSAMLNRITL
jgi:uncharacterized LabA/DUF88 family protein